MIENILLSYKDNYDNAFFGTIETWKIMLNLYLLI